MGIHDLCGSSENILSLMNYGLRASESADNKNQIIEANESSDDSAENSTEQSSGQGVNNTADKDSSSSSPTKDDNSNGKDEGDNNNTHQNKDNSNEDSKESSTEEDVVDDDAIAKVSDLSDTNRRIYVVTTAGLPWRTGTAVNPLARALYLTRGRPKHYVTLMIPWLEKKEDQAKVYGDISFDTQDEQEAWIRNYSKERVNCEKEEENLQIKFYPALYHDMFGSIFASVDICSIIPEEEADIAILEEPEHLTWFRCLPKIVVEHSEQAMDTKSTSNQNDKERQDAIIGWTAKFSYIVGILHTNYSAYMRQYGLGAGLVTASALQALSAIVVRAYTHRLIRLSDTLPELDRAKEVTCNVHGVRSEFFDPPNETTKGEDVDEAKTADDNDGDDNDSESFDPQPIYFIGKVIWAKGFDKLLEIEDMYKKEYGEYFPIDVYGSGPDSAAIKRAFFGRNNVSNLSKKPSSGSLASDGSLTPRGRSLSPPPTAADQTAALLFSREGSLRGLMGEGQTIPEDSLVVEVQTCETPTSTEGGTPSSASIGPQNPLDVMTHLGETTVQTGSSVSKAIAALSEKITNVGLRVAFSEQEPTGQEIGKEEPKFFFDPPKTRYELRRYPIPARFLGVKDHALLRDIPEHKIFVNLSITEVLCTTTAEALAMGKFVIIPKHPSNTFFLQFPNCLAYETKKECVEKVKWAVENDPKPLSPEDRHKLTWEGANQRLYESSTMKEKDAKVMNKRAAEFARIHMETMKTGAFFQGFLAGRNKNKKK